MILITGASGSVGREVLREMQKSGAEFCAMYRSKEDAAKAPGGVKTTVADFSDRSSLLNAFRGIERVFLVCSPIQELVELEGNAIEACEKAGVKQIVLNSALGAGDYDKSFPSWHRKVEDKLKTSGISFVILRPNGFMQNVVTYLAPSIRAQGAFYDAMGEAKTSYVDVRDVGAIAATVLVSAGAHAGKTYELNGPEAITQDELAQRIGANCGREVKHVNIPREAHRKAMLDLGMPEWQVTALIELQDYYVSGRAANVDRTIERLLGRPPRRITAFLGENAQAFRT
jgi:uncharacterized protein YbjT (DUF2867 family)